jgi:hypothetical protein
VTAQQRDAGVVEHARVDAVEALNVGAARLHQPPPVELHVADVEAVIGGVVQRFGDAGGVPHHLFGHAADVDAGAAQTRGFHHRHARAVLRRPPRGRDAAAAAADDEVIEGLAHQNTPGAPISVGNRSRK